MSYFLFIRKIALVNTIVTEDIIPSTRIKVDCYRRSAVMWDANRSSSFSTVVSKTDMATDFFEEMVIMEGLTWTLQSIKDKASRVLSLEGVGQSPLQLKVGYVLAGQTWYRQNRISNDSSFDLMACFKILAKVQLLTFPDLYSVRTKVKMGTYLHRGLENVKEEMWSNIQIVECIQF